jgi:hypothetical protein
MPWKQCPHCENNTVNPMYGRCVVCNQKPAECVMTAADIADMEARPGELLFPAE